MDDAALRRIQDAMNDNGYQKYCAWADGSSRYAMAICHHEQTRVLWHTFFREGRLACLGSTVRIPGSKVVRLVVSMPELRDRVRGDQHGGRRLRVAAETLRQWIRQAESWTLTRAPGICCSARHDAEGKGLRAAFPAPEDTPERHPSEIGLIMRAAFVLTLFEYKRLTWKLLRKPHLIT